MSKTKITIILISCIIICAVLWILYGLKIIYHLEAEIASLIGCVISMFAWIITLFQLSEIRKTGEITKEAIENTQKNINHLFAISDISVAIGYSREVKNYVKDGKYDLASFRMHDVKKIVWSLERIEKKIPRENDYSNIKVNVDVIMSNLNIYKSNPIKLAKFNLEIEEIISFLLTVDNALKKINND